MTIEVMQTKICGSCRRHLCSSEFHSDSRSKDGKRASCKSCRKRYTSKYNELNRERINARQREYNKDPSVKERHRSWCSQYYQDHKEDIDKRKQLWAEQNRDKVRQSARKSQGRSLKDPLKAEKHRMRSRLAMAFSAKGSKDKPKTEAMLGCTWPELLMHIESLFCDGMSWDNRHLWHIDHVIPLDAAESAEHLADLCHYTNLQPLWAKDNLSKGAKVDYRKNTTAP